VFPSLLRRWKGHFEKLCWEGAAELLAAEQQRVAARWWQLELATVWKMMGWNLRVSDRLLFGTYFLQLRLE
jgi:hypothetical protein